MTPSSASVYGSFVVLLEHGEVLVDVVRGTQNHRDPLVDVVGLDVQHTHAARGSEASSLLHDECHGVALIQQPQLQWEDMEGQIVPRETDYSSVTTMGSSLQGILKTNQRM